MSGELEKKSKLEQLADNEALVCRRMIEEENEEVITRIVGIAGDELLYIVCPWRSQRERDGILAKVTAIFRQKKVSAYLTIAEAWMGEEQDGLPSQNPAREEVLLIAGVDKVQNQKFMRTYPIKNNVDGTRTLETEKMNCGEIGGKLATLLDIDLSLN